MNILFYAWLIVALVFLVLEMGHPGLLFFLSFSVGSVIAALSVLYELSLVLQCIVFITGTVATIFLLNYWVSKKSKKYHTHHQTNVYALKGVKGRVTQSISPDMSGEVKLGGQLWSARSVHNKSISIGTLVHVVDIKGVHVFVEQVKTN